MEQGKVYSHTKLGFYANPYRASLKGERWEQVPNTEYFVSNYARALHRVKLKRPKRLPRLPFTKDWGKTKYRVHNLVSYSMRIIHPRELYGGKNFKIYKDGKIQSEPYMHLLLADLFQLREPGEKVLFRDGDSWNPHLRNLKVKGQRELLSPRQKKFCKELFAKYPKRIIIQELAYRFVVSYTKVYLLHREWEYENESSVIVSHDDMGYNSGSGAS